MNVTIIQTDPYWEEKTKNFERIESLISEIRWRTDIVILPEMFSTGFSMQPEKTGELPASETFLWMKKLAASLNSGVCGSYVISENSKFFNRWIFVSPENNFWSYDKRHLFRMGNEDKSFTAGNKRVIISYRGVRILPNICYDLRFPVWSRNINDYDLLINSANWPLSRKEVWTTLLKARALENQCFVAGANRTGTDGAGIRYCGSSQLINPRGEILASAEEETESIVSAEISMSELNDLRKKFPVWMDADDFTINL